MRLTDWRPPRWTEQMPPAAWDIVREKHHILVDGDEPIPPPLERFEDLKVRRGDVFALLLTK
jgi:ATP-dependent RNA helicase DDX41